MSSIKLSTILEYESFVLGRFGGKQVSKVYKIGSPIRHEEGPTITGFWTMGYW